VLFSRDIQLHRDRLGKAEKFCLSKVIALPIPTKNKPEKRKGIYGECTE
jgi:hypothetical protein